MTEYRLHSTGLVYTPGFLNWAKVGSLSDHDKMVEIVSRGFNLPYLIAEGLMTGEIDYRVEGETVVFEVEDDYGPDEQKAWYDTSKELD